MKKKVKKVLFLTKESAQIRLSEPHYVVLSPEYYWVRKVSVPVSSAYQAKAYAPSVMEDLLPPDKNYSYDVLATGEKSLFVMIAYDREEITAVLEKQIVSHEEIHSLYWTQTVLADMQGCIRIDTKHALLKINDIISLAPIHCQTPSATLGQALRSGYFSRCAFALHSWGDRFSVLEKILKPLVALLVLIALATGLDLALQRYRISQTVEQTTQLRKYYHLPATSMQFKSILSSLGKKDKKQRAVRAMLESVGKAHFPKGVLIQSMRYENGVLTFTIPYKPGAEEKALDAYFRQRGAKVHVMPNLQQVRVEMSYE